MREVSFDFLKSEVLRLRALVTQTRLFHPCGTKLHHSGVPITPVEIQAMQEAGIKSLLVLDPGETEQEALKRLTTEIVDASGLIPGDFLAQDLRDPAGELVASAGSPVDPAALAKANIVGSMRVAIKRRKPEPGAEQAGAYLAKIPPVPKLPRPDSRMGRPVEAMTGARPPFVPRARIWVSVADDFHRSLIVNAFTVEGHEVIDRKWVDRKESDFNVAKLDLLIVDLASAAEAVKIMRKGDLLNKIPMLVAAPEGKKQDVFKAISAGANGSVTVPPKREQLLDKLRSTLQAFGRSVNLKLDAQGERRAEAREPGNIVCTLQDKFLKTALPVKDATVLDLSEHGLKIEYGRKEWPFHVYIAHAVHPQHPFFNYAQDNPLGRDVTIALPPIGGRTLEGNAKFVHVTLNGAYEVAGLKFHRMSTSVREHVTAVRTGGRPPTTVKRP